MCIRDSISELQTILASQPDRLLRNLARQFTIYSTGRDVSFSDRDALEVIVADAQKSGGGVRTLLHTVVQSPLFQTK